MTWNSTCPGLSALPVNIVSFGGKLSGDYVRLNWIAENEQAFDRFEIERSFNGITFQKIGEVKAASARTYYFNDQVDAIRGRQVYYRLRKVDRDGSSTLTAVLKLHIPLNTRFTVYPNPAGEIIRLQMNKTINGKLGITITDLSGRVLRQSLLQATGSSMNITTEGLKNGTYLLKISYLNEEYVQKVVVSK
jgi:hypothetical protein